MKIPKSTNGKYFTKQLFWEESITLAESVRTIPPIFTLTKDKPGLINFGKVYVECGDPSGYKVTEKLLDGDYTLWQVLMGCRWFVAAKEMWDKELDAKLSSEAMEKIRLLLQDGRPAQQLAAAKYLANKEYRKDKITTKGRPKQTEIDRAASDLAVRDKELKDDLERIQAIK